MNANIKINCSIKEAMIFAAGIGNRMRYKTKFKAKPLIKVNNKELLNINLERLSLMGIRSCIINTNYKHLSVKNFIKRYQSRNKYPKINIIHENERLETGGGFKIALKYFHTNNILLINGDSLLVNNLIECPIKNLSNNFLPHKMDILLLLSTIRDSVGYTGSGDYIKDFQGTPASIKRKNYNANKKNALIFTGWQVINKNILNNIKSRKFSLNAAYDLAEKNNRLYGVTHNGTFLHLSTPKSFMQVQKYLKYYSSSLL